MISTDLLSFSRKHMPKYCRVRGCHFAWTHVTSYHVCGQCHQFGHGVVECGHAEQIAQLAEDHSGQVMPYAERCDVMGCPNRKTHSSGSHICRQCQQRHDETHCRRGVTAPLYPHAPAHAPAPVPLHAPSPPPVSVPVTPPSSPQEITCPICRQVNQIPPDQSQVYGVDMTCVICRDAPSRLFLPKCGHICLCLECGELLAQAHRERQQPADHSLVWGRPEPPPRDLVERIMGPQEGSIYTVISAGMGCLWYVKRPSTRDPIETYIVDAEDWSSPERLHQLRQFITGYSEV